MNTFILQIIMFIFVYFAHIQSQVTDTSVTSDITTIVSESHSDTTPTVITKETVQSSTKDSTLGESIPTSSLHTASTQTIQSSPSHSAVTETIESSISSSTFTVTKVSLLRDSDGTGSHSFISTTIISPTGETSINTLASVKYSSISLISTNSSSTTTTTTTTPQIPSVAINTNITLRYKYIITSPLPLKLENITNITILNDVRRMIITSFNITSTNITVIHVEIRSQTNTRNIGYDMIATILFLSSNTYDANQINTAILVPTQNFSLPSENGSLVLVTPVALPVLVKEEQVTNPPATFSRGESPPGLGAQIGLGLGIPIITFVLIGEIVFLYRKYGLTKSTNRSQYELPSYGNRPSI